jgi:hypothetical protein
VEEGRCKENYLPRTPPLFLYDHAIHKKLNLSWNDSLHQKDRDRGVCFSLHQDKAIEEFSNDKPLNIDTKSTLDHVSNTRLITNTMLVRYELAAVDRLTEDVTSPTPNEELTFSCEYCRIISSISKSSNYNISPSSFDTLDLYERHIVKNHAGHTAYPGPADIQRFEREFGEREQGTGG